MAATREPGASFVATSPAADGASASVVEFEFGSGTGSGTAADAAPPMPRYFAAPPHDHPPSDSREAPVSPQVSAPVSETPAVSVSRPSVPRARFAKLFAERLDALRARRAGPWGPWRRGARGPHARASQCRPCTRPAPQLARRLARSRGAACAGAPRHGPHERGAASPRDARRAAFSVAGLGENARFPPGLSFASLPFRRDASPLAPSPRTPTRARRTRARAAACRSWGWAAGSARGVLGRAIGPQEHHRHRAGGLRQVREARPCRTTCSCARQPPRSPRNTATAPTKETSETSSGSVSRRSKGSSADVRPPRDEAPSRRALGPTRGNETRGILQLRLAQPHHLVAPGVAPAPGLDILVVLRARGVRERGVVGVRVGLALGAER